MPTPVQEVAQAEKDILLENNENEWISSHTSSQAIMMAKKKESRLAKNKVFHGFVLEVKSKEDNEFTTFLEKLKENAKNIPSGTRIQLALSLHLKAFSPESHLPDLYQEKHWISVDMMVGENGNVSSLVLDPAAAAAYGYKEIHAQLKETFPGGEHYMYVPDSKIMKSSLIQTQNIGCRVFVTEHLKQLSQIDTDTLYTKELPHIANDDNHISAKQFTGGLKLTRIFRGMQSWSSLNALPDEVKDTIIKEKGAVTLIKSSEKQSVTIESKKINKTIENKNKKYKKEKSNYFQNKSSDIKSKIMENKTGFSYLEHPVLFQLDNLLNSKDPKSAASYISDFTKKFNGIISRQLREKNRLNQLNSFMTEFKSISENNDQKSTVEIKSDFLLTVASLFKYLNKNGSNIGYNIEKECLNLQPTLVQQLEKMVDNYDAEAALVFLEKNINDFINNESCLNYVINIENSNLKKIFISHISNSVKDEQTLAIILKKIPGDGWKDFLKSSDILSRIIPPDSMVSFLKKIEPAYRRIELIKCFDEQYIKKAINSTNKLKETLLSLPESKLKDPSRQNLIAKVTTWDNIQPSITDITHIASMLNESGCVDFINKLDKSHLQKILQPHKVLTEAMEELTFDKEKEALVVSLGSEHIIKLINTPQELGLTLKYLSKEEQLKLVDKMADKLKDIFKDDREVISFLKNSNNYNIRTGAVKQAIALGYHIHQLSPSNQEKESKKSRLIKALHEVNNPVSEKAPEKNSIISAQQNLKNELKLYKESVKKQGFFHKKNSEEKNIEKIEHVIKYSR